MDVRFHHGSLPSGSATIISWTLHAAALYEIEQFRNASSGASFRTTRRPFTQTEARPTTSEDTDVQVFCFWKACTITTPLRVVKRGLQEV